MTSRYNIKYFNEFIDKIVDGNYYSDKFISLSFFNDLKECYKTGFENFSKLFDKYPENSYNLEKCCVIGDKHLFDIGSSYIAIYKNSFLAFFSKRENVANWYNVDDPYGIIFTNEYKEFLNSVYPAHKD